MTRPALISYPLLDIVDDRSITIGQHSLWLPALDVKVPFQYGGKVQKYKKPSEAEYDVSTLAEEVALLKYLASQEMAPPVGGWAYFETVISEHHHAWWADPLGAYGFELLDVAKLFSPGRFDVEMLKRSGMIEGSEGAWNDLIKAKNILRGYAVDVRRSWFDNLRWKGAIEPMPRHRVDRTDLIARLYREGSFPFGEREQPYQEFYLDGSWRSAERDVVKRAGLLGFTPSAGESVIDLGTCTGGFLTYAMLLGAHTCIGLDFQDEFVDLARTLARANGHNICYRQVDLSRGDPAIVAWLHALAPRPDHLLMLSMGKHLSEPTMFWWADAINAKHTYFETNALKSREQATDYPNNLLWRYVKQLGGVHVGFTEDRNLRAVYRVDRA